MIRLLRFVRQAAPDDLFTLQGLLLTYSAAVVLEVIACIVLAEIGRAWMMIGPIVGVSSSGVAVGVAVGVHAERHRWEDSHRA